MIRLILIVFFFLLSLLTVLKGQAYYLWLMSIFVSEFSWIFCVIVILLLACGFWSHKYQLASTIVGFLALVFYLSPIVRANSIAQTLPHQLDAAFGPSASVTQSPFHFFNLFKGKGKNDIPFKSLTYVSYPDTSLNLDFFASKVAGKRPCVIVVHGGSWSGGDSYQLPELNSYLANKGYQVAAINYRLAPKYQCPAPVQDIQSCLSYLRLHANELNIDTNKFVLLGRSAGAQISLLAAYTLHDASLKGVIDFYGPADMVWGYSIPSNPLIMDSRLVMRNYLGGSYDDVPQNFVAASPLEFVSKQSPPTLIIHGYNDVLVAYEHSRRLNLKLQKYGIPHYFLSIPWATHGFDYNLNGPSAQLSTYAVERFLNHVTTN